MLFATVVPFGGPIVIDDPVTFIVPAAPVARTPTWPAELAVVVAVVRIVLPLILTVLPDSASAPRVPAAARLIVLLSTDVVPPLDARTPMAVPAMVPLLKVSVAPVTAWTPLLEALTFTLLALTKPFAPDAFIPAVDPTIAVTVPPVRVIVPLSAFTPMAPPTVAVRLRLVALMFPPLATRRALLVLVIVPPVREIRAPSVAAAPKEPTLVADRVRFAAVMVELAPVAASPVALVPVVVTEDPLKMVMAPPLSAATAWEPAPPVLNVNGLKLWITPPLSE